VAANSGSILVEALATGFGDGEASRLLHHPLDRALIDESVECVGESTVVQARSGGHLKILKRGTPAAPCWAAKPSRASSTVTL